MIFFKRKEKKDLGAEAPIEVKADSGCPAENQQREIAARQGEAMPPLKELIYDALVKNAAKVMLDYSRDAVTGSYLIDGVWHSIEPRDRETGDAMLIAFKLLGGMKPEERRARQEGKFQVEHKITKAKFLGNVTSQGVKTGERVIIEVRPKKVKGFKTLDDLGMREQMQERLREHMRAESGLVLISAPPGGGFTTTWNVALNSTDRLLRDFVGIESKNHHETDVENINMTLFDETAGETPDQLMHKLMLTQPDVLTLPDLCNAATVNKLCQLANASKEAKLTIAGVRAKDAVEALLRVLLLKASSKDFAQAVRAVLNVRLIRKLNDTCKQPYQPPPQLLQKLGIPPGRVQALYREWQPPPPDPEEEKKRKKKVLPPGACPICEMEGPQCHGIFYRGRTAIFELLDVNDAMREALVKQPKLEVLRKIARASGHHGLQEEGILLVARGITSLNELQRVLK
ncbi:MAG: Flp pilus assembly complex ATPase component TadA [Planctomycetes bacterium]|nr:Flp pilus assembly complex ATPase component TadA [Planctomycetota bacterium]